MRHRTGVQVIQPLRAASGMARLPTPDCLAQDSCFSVWRVRNHSSNSSLLPIETRGVAPCVSGFGQKQTDFHKEFLQFNDLHRITENQRRFCNLQNSHQTPLIRTESTALGQ